MSNSKYFLIQFTMLAIYASIVVSCHKETPPPSPIGKWETVQAFGYKYQHEFKTDGQTCRRLPEAFGTTAFCYDYQFDNSTMAMTINTNAVETWQWSFVCDDVADVTVTLPDSSVQRYILKRTN